MREKNNWFVLLLLVWALATSVARGQAGPGASARHRQLMDRYDVQFYQLDLTLSNTSRAIAGSVLLRVRVGALALDSLAFELYQAPPDSLPTAPTLVIDSVVAGGRRAPGVVRRGPAATAALAAPAPAGALLDARVYYHGTAPHGNTNAVGNAFNSADHYRRAGVDYPYHVTWSLSEPFSAHEWFPCKQVLTDKADSAAVFITTDLPNKVGSNGVLARTVPLPGNRVRYEWHERHPIAYYLISVAVAPYVEYVTYAQPTGGPRLPIVNYVYDPESLAYYKADIDRTAGFIENYSNLFGTFFFADEKYGHALAPIGGGMEHQTMTTLGYFDFTLVAHELFHQWFGDNVTCASWEDIWLNEGFASYGEYLSLQAFGPPAAARAWMDDAQARAQSSRTGTVRVPDTTSVRRIFDYNLSYKKGAAVIHQLRYLCHDDARFYRVLRRYQSEFSGHTARTADLQRLFEAELGPLDYFFQQWYRGEGFPAFDVRWNQGGSTLLLQVAETASVPASTPFFRTEVDYELTFQDGTTRRVRLNQTQASQSFSVAVSGTVVAVAVDPDGWLPDLPGSVRPDPALVLAVRSAAHPAPALYPNPCREELIISNLIITAATAEVYDATGRLVLRQALPPARPVVRTQALAPGLYLLRLRGPAGEVLSQGRFGKE